MTRNAKLLVGLVFSALMLLTAALLLGLRPEKTRTATRNALPTLSATRVAVELAHPPVATSVAAAPAAPVTAAVASPPAEAPAAWPPPDPVAAAVAAPVTPLVATLTAVQPAQSAPTAPAPPARARPKPAQSPQVRLSPPQQGSVSAAQNKTVVGAGANQAKNQAQSYVAQVQKHLAAYAEGMVFDGSGAAVLRFTVDSAGQVSEVELSQSSGDTGLDQLILELPQLAQPMPATPKSLRLSVPVQVGL